MISDELSVVAGVADLVGRVKSLTSRLNDANETIAELVAALEAADLEVTRIHERGNGWPSSATLASSNVRLKFIGALTKVRASR